MVRKTNLGLMAAILLFCATSLNALDVSGITIALPSDCRAKLRWVSPPLDSKTVRETNWYYTYNWHETFCFAVDAAGQPWFAVPDRSNRKGVVLNPIQQYRFGLSHPFKGMACLDNGAWLFHTDHDLGFISPPETLPVEDGVAVVPFQPTVTLPLPDCRIYSGANSALYIVGTAGNGDNEVYLLQPETLSENGPQRILRSFRKVFASEKPIGAVTGDGRTTFIALDRTIVQIQHEGQTQADILVHPTSSIRQLAYSPMAGLFYVTDNRVGLVGEHGTWDFLSLNWSQITLRGDSLYVCLFDTLGVLALDNISDLAKYAPNGRYTPQARPSLPVEVTNIQFRAQPVDPNGKMLYGAEFERSSISQVYGIVSLHPKSEQAINAVLTVVWDGPKDLREDGCMLGGRVVDFFLHFKDGKDQQWRFKPTFMFYPGEYSMKVLLDGVEVKTGYFKVTGKTTVTEAAMQDNIPLLQALLEQGANPDERGANVDGTALHTAVGNCSKEAVELLLKYGAQVDARTTGGETPLFAIHFGPSDDAAEALDIEKLLIKHGADVTARNNVNASVLVWFVSLLKRGPIATDLVGLLLQHGAPVDERVKEGQTLLARLAFYSSPGETVYPAECLIRYGANVSATDKDGESVLSKAVSSGNVDLVQVLLEHGANPNKPDIDKDGDKDYPLLNVSYYNASPSQMLELLLTHGANPNVEEFRGFTALSEAIEEADPASVWILLKYGASLTADCRVDYEIGSPLRGALSSYLKYADKDRVKAQKAKDIFFMLLEGGAQLRPPEESIVADKRLHGWLPRELILDVLKRNDRAVLEARDVTDWQIQSVVITRLLEMAKTKAAAATSNEDFSAALALCDQAKTRAQIWKIEPQCPLIYYNTGLLYGQLRQLAAAKDNFKRYLDLAPAAPEAEHVRELLLK